MMRVTHTVKIIKKDGTEAQHTAKAVRYSPQADGGAVTVSAMCCGDIKTLSNHTFYDAAAMDADAILKEVQDHVERVANHHAGTHKATETLDGLEWG